MHDTRGSRPDMQTMLGPPRPDVRLSCFGPHTMLDTFEAAAAAWPQDQVHVERFVAPAVPVDPAAAPYTLLLAKLGRRLDVPAGLSMLDAIAECGVDVP